MLNTISHCKYETRLKVTDRASTAAYYIVAKSLIVLSTVSHCKYETRLKVTDIASPAAYYIVLNKVLYYLAPSVIANMRQVLK